ncbi:hypothetical protein LJC39_00650 [Parabacteroides sp. OttesenSCG-928-B22]|nr:hypothetical protein [Parabacteroides sp. OttesenSCG-928-B22]
MMNKSFSILFQLIVCWVIAQSAFAQKIQNVRFQPFGQDIHVQYDLKGLSFDSYALLNLYVSTNGGESFIGPLAQVDGNIGKVTGNGAKTVIWHAVRESGNINGQIVFEIRGDVSKEKIKAENMLFYNVSGSSAAGLMYGRVARWGGYLRVKTNFSFEDAPYSCNDAGEVDYPGHYRLNASVHRSRLGVTAGMLYRTNSWLYLYGGAGAGFRRLIWLANTFEEDLLTPGKEIAAINTDHSAEGVELELGGIIRYKRLGITVGVNLIDFRFAEINGGIGFFF